jgi:4-amino-4-deoxy-L-arabinose transferase-like glycosyltransferase
MGVRPRHYLLLTLWCVGLTLIAVAFRTRLPTDWWDGYKMWYAARRLADGLPYGNGSHHTVRFSILLPAAALVKVFGHQAWLYTLPSILAFFTSLLLLGRIAFRFGGLGFAMLCMACFATFPYVMTELREFKDGIFGIAYSLAGIWALLRAHESTRLHDRNLWLVATGLFVFLGYLAKITNLFFFPGFIVATALLFRQWRAVLLMVGTVALGYFVETGLYALLTEYKLGQVQIIQHTYGHSGRLKPVGFLGLFRRYTELGTFAQAYYVAFLLAFVPLLRKKARDPRRLAVYSIGLSFLFFITFYVKGWNPVVQGILFRPRYIMAVSGVLALGALLPLARPLAHLNSHSVTRWVALSLVTISLLAGTYGLSQERLPPRALAQMQNKLENHYANGLAIVTKPLRRNEVFPRLFCATCLKTAGGKTIHPEKIPVFLDGQPYMAYPTISGEAPRCPALLVTTVRWTLSIRSIACHELRVGKGF